LRFDLTNAVAIVGLYSRPQPLAQEAQRDDKLIIQKNGHRFHISPNEMLLKFSDSVFIHMSGGGIIFKGPRLDLN
jgi:hypothetical protein